MVRLAGLLGALPFPHAAVARRRNAHVTLVAECVRPCDLVQAIRSHGAISVRVSMAPSCGLDCCTQLARLLTDGVRTRAVSVIFPGRSRVEDP